MSTILEGTLIYLLQVRYNQYLDDLLKENLIELT